VPDSFFLTAFALAPTAEKDLADIQKSLFALYGCPSAFALPPLWPLFSGRSEPPREKLMRLRKQNRPRFCFCGYARRGTILFADCAPLDPVPVPALWELPGFYLADMQAPGAWERNLLPALPAYTVKTLRLIVMKVIAAKDPWWRGLEWSLISEDWIKLA
jgi:hypothetical protein